MELSNADEQKNFEFDLGVREENLFNHGGHGGRREFFEAFLNQPPTNSRHSRESGNPETYFPARSAANKTSLPRKVSRRRQDEGSLAVEPSSPAKGNQ
jgi:hypothetical protein